MKAEGGLKEKDLRELATCKIGELIIRNAELSADGKYRWWLRRTFEDGKGVVCFIMLNPSTADANIDDPTIRQCMGFAHRWGYRTLSVRNLFPYRAANPRKLLTACDPIGSDRGNNELAAGFTAELVVAAWGTWVPFERDKEAIQLSRGREMKCLGVTKNGNPRHPLYVRWDQELIAWPK